MDHPPVSNPYDTLIHEALALIAEAAQMDKTGFSVKSAGEYFSRVSIWCQGLAEIPASNNTSLRHQCLSCENFRVCPHKMKGIAELCMKKGK